MRRRRNTVMAVGVIWWALASCAQGPESYLKTHVGQVTQDEMQARLGRPDRSEPTENGGSKWTYIHHVSTATYLTYANPDVEMCYRYELLFDAQKILRNWSKASYACGTVN